MGQNKVSQRGGINYHTRQVGRPALEKQLENANVTETLEQKKKRKALLRGEDGALSCPIDIMATNHVITAGMADAIKTYGRLWALAYGQPSRYSGNVWRSIIQGYGFNDSPEEDVDRKRAKVKKYHEADDVLKSYGTEAWLCVRMICEGKTPVYLQTAIQQHIRRAKILRQIEALDKILENIKNHSKKTKQHTSQSASIVQQKRRCLRQMEELSHLDYSSTGQTESYFHVWARDQFKMALRGLMREFKIQD